MAPCWKERGSLVDYVETAFQTKEVVPLQTVLLSDLREGFGALARTAHEFFL